jgi:trigger factor
MNISKLEQVGLKHTFKVVFSPSEIEEKTNSYVVKLGKSVSVPGFRKGKVPISYLKSKYGDSAYQESIKDFISSAIKNVTSGVNLLPGIKPKISDLNANDKGELEVNVSYEIMGDIPEIKLDNFSVTKLIPKFSQSDFEKFIIEEYESSPSLREVSPDSEIGLSHVVLINYTGIVDDRVINENNDQLLIDMAKPNLIDGFIDNLLGAKVNDSRHFNLNFPKDYVPELAGKECHFCTDIVRISEKIPHSEMTKKEIADLLLNKYRQELSGEESEEEIITKFDEFAKDLYAERLKVLSETHLKKQLLDLVDKSYNFLVPEAMIDMELENVLVQLRSDKDSKIDWSNIELLRTNYRIIAERRVRLGFLLSEYSKKIEINFEEDFIATNIRKKICEIASRTQDFSVFGKLRDNKFLNELKAMIFEDKILGVILERASVTEKHVSEDELESILELDDLEIQEMIGKNK